MKSGDEILKLLVKEECIWRAGWPVGIEFFATRPLGMSGLSKRENAEMNITKCMSALTVARERINAAMAGLAELSTLITGQASGSAMPATGASTAAHKVGKASHTKRDLSPEQRAVLSAAAKGRWDERRKKEAAKKAAITKAAKKVAAHKKAPAAEKEAA
jgi:hypothetical protein